MRNIHHPICTVIPPHILRHVAEHGDDDARKKAEATMRHTRRFALERSRASNDTPDGPAALTPKRREVYDAQHKRNLPGKLVMSDHGGLTSRDIEAVEAFEGSGVTSDFYAKVLFRNSIDGKGMPIISTVHYGQKFDNAMWAGGQMIYGDGDGKLFNRFTIDLTVEAHELTHGVTQHTAALEYHDQSGALNEHLSDAVGSMVKQWRLGQTVSQADFLIGKDLLGPDVQGVAIRSMKAPGTAYDDPVLGRDPQPAHMRDYVVTTDDNGGVHINSGILNHAFFLFATGVGGYSWEVPCSIWYPVQKTKLFPHAGFQDFAAATVSMAGQLYGTGSAVQSTLIDAWSEVGLPVTPAPKKTALPSNRTKWRNRPVARAKA
jgi:Zn-dependent metalloprotease